ncbi:hypothetical protein RI129_012943 [Pyrocoelia pectoralis]|uniref:Uncharacterized protein n=1 Tax=Pyrocoelia pectoralis TaxID=417401 RepID=A0AAN7ZGM6_9COLE
MKFMCCHIYMIIFMCVICKILYVRSYYWKEYRGEIPIDAVPADTNKARNSTYIGQIFIQGRGLLPATIVAGSKIAISIQGTMIKTDKNIMILCSKEQDKFTWRNAKVGEKQSLTACCPSVNGGVEWNEIINIGRVNREGETIVGPVFTNLDKGNGLWIPHKGKEMRVMSYEVLTFNCKN